MHNVYRQDTQTGRLPSHSYRNKLVATTSKLQRNILKNRTSPVSMHFQSSSIRLALLLNLMFFYHFPCKTRCPAAWFFQLFHEKPMNAMLRKFSPLLSSFRSEAKRIMQIFKLSKHVFRSTLSHANPTDLAEWLVCDSHTVECYSRNYQYLH